MRAELTRMAKRIGREFFPEHVDIITSDDNPMLEDASDYVELRARDTSGDEPRFGVAAIHGRLLHSPHLENAIRHELRGLAQKMGYISSRSRSEGA